MNSNCVCVGKSGTHYLLVYLDNLSLKFSDKMWVNIQMKC